MAIPQTSMSLDPDKAYAGQVESANQGDIISKFAQVALTNGIGVIQGTDDKGATVPAASGDITGLPFLGISVYDPSKMVNWPSGTVPYPIGQMVSVLRKGRIWVYVEEAVTPASTVYCRYTANGAGKTVGQFRASDDTSKAAAVPGARYMTTAGIGGLALLDLNLPQ